ncbi:Prolyl 4-hydroxylase alpha subunit [Arabidopsis thaliana x Arabidopsis arenosa]|nr:2-oxoglutarate (2OG) and Fe(II)-dependent oxygenase superfamily protein [Arabidopsis thaliana]ANM70144.1 2-oxoglutarate (2OG) and Fe(II)-dependent oxygenase superfamily protein [Arabidopsis thaliana]KAG7604792.1 Prolyl 4-hydroxylase alpha subunit [Arabidopsis thaliana x Arabidopsis arenosa]OAO95027.1 hypothetical protein AXX17_AT5G41690 [Arabidopsis thaliana]BAB11629.1 unnamed protein product [Arabidopsis thaliana]|eukprot:NP_001331775.1 2-oxoglutarate (2OG) and Fe(II)-dependent oxygenase superfamily protein [Arabidopsis thaliana]
MAIPRLSLLPNNEHNSDNYEDLELEFSSSVLRSLERYLPPEILTANREEKAKFMSDILHKYISREECAKAIRFKNYREWIMSNYQPRFRELYKLDPESLLLPCFRKAVRENTEESFRRIMFEPFPGVYVFKMFQPDFFQKLLVEVENMRKWLHEAKLMIRKPNNKSKYGVVLDDFGMDIMLKPLVEDFIFPICKVFFPQVCGTMFDTQHGFVIENCEDRDAELGFHVENSDITLNVCLSKQSEGGEILFTGTRCNKHLKAGPKPEEIFEYCHEPGQAILHLGCHSHGAKAAITSCSRANMILWCINSLFREMQTYDNEFRDWCGQCAREKKEKKSQSLASKRKVKKRKKDMILLKFIRCFV